MTYEIVHGPDFENCAAGIMHRPLPRSMEEVQEAVKILLERHPTWMIRIKPLNGKTETQS